MQYTKSEIKNGARIILVPNKNIETTTVLAIFAAGSRDEKGQMEGIAHFLEHMFFKGTERRPEAADINRELDGVGASYNAFTGKEYTGFWIKTEKKDLPLSLNILSDMLLNSKFKTEEIDNERGAIIEEINMYEDAPMRDIPSVFENMLYAGQVLGHDQLGGKDNIRNFTRKDFLNFYKKHYRADNLIVAVSGNFEDRTVKEQIKKSFLPFQKTKRPARRAKISDRQKSPQIFIKYKKTDQTNFSLGFRAFPNGHKDQYVLDVLNVILGGNSSSRLYENIRAKSGLAYYIYTYTEEYFDAGYITAQSGVGNDKCEKAIAMTMEEYRKAKEEKVPDLEIKKAKSYIKGRLAISLESSSSLASFIASQELLTGKILTPQEKFDKINAVTAEDLQRVARKIFTPDRLNLALIGPFKSGKKFEKLLKI